MLIFSLYYLYADLCANNYIVENNSEDFLKIGDICEYDTIILYRRNLHEMCDIVREIRAHTNSPMMTFVEEGCSQGDVESLIDHGVDDCMRLPLSLDELYARLESLRRRERKTRFTDTEISIGDLMINLKEHTVFATNHHIPLTKTEYKFLCQLAIHKGLVVSREVLGMYLPHAQEAKVSHAVTMHIFNLRKKVYGHACIDTVSSQGFMFLPTGR